MLAATTDVHAGGELWRSDWLESSPPTFARVYGYGVTPDGTIAFAANGDILLGSNSYTWSDYQIIRISTEGSLRWSTNVGGTLWAREEAPNAMIATADGGALVAFGKSYLYGTPEYLVRIDATGTVAWAREIPAQALAEIAPDRVVATGCGAVTLLEEASGNVTWQTTASSCPSSARVTVDEAGNIYTLLRVGTDVHAVRQNSQGIPTWEISLGTGTGSSEIVGTSGDLVFAQANGTLTALRVADGSTAWSTAASGLVLVTESPVEPVLVTTSTVTRFAASTGQPRWTTPLLNNGLAAIVGNNLIAGTSSSSLKRIDLTTGAAGWSTTLPGQDGFGHGVQYFALGGSSGGSFVAAALPYGSSPVPPLLERVTLADGSPAGSVPLPSITQAPYGASDGSAAGPVVGVLSAWTTTFPELRTRRLDPADGSTIWEQSEPLDIDLDGGTTSFQVIPSVALGSDAVVAGAAIEIPAGTFDIGMGALWLGAYELASGQPRWQTVLRDPEHGDLRSGSPVVDAHGDVLVEISTAVACDVGQSSRCGRRTLFKLSKDDGHVIWQSPQTFTFQNNMWVSNLVLVGDDIIASGPYFDDFDSPTLRYVTGASGATCWTSNIFGRDDIASVRPTETGILVVGDGDGWAELDAVTGSAHWTGPAFSSPCANACLENGGVVLPGGDVLVIGEGGYQAQVSRLSGNGNGAYQNWALVPNNPTVQSQAVDIRSDAAGGIWLGILHGNRNRVGGLSVLAKFDPTTGALLSQQVLLGESGDLLEPLTYGGWLGSPEGGRLLINSFAAHTPAATASGNALIDTTITAHGDLALTLSVDRSQIDATGLLGVSAHITYTGDAPVTGAHIGVHLPWGSGARNVTCSVSGASACTTETRAGNLLATVDLTPGAIVDLTAQVLPLAAGDTTPTVSGVVFGPPGLDEDDTLNNLAQAGTAPDEVFANGFDGN